jgi:hypothetical protein
MIATPSFLVPGLTRDLSFHTVKRLGQPEAPGQARGGLVL